MKVKYYNTMVARVTLLMRVSWARFVKNSLEQPVTSIMNEMKRLAALIDLLGLKEFKSYMGNFGGDSSKCLKFFTDTEFMRANSVDKK